MAARHRAAFHVLGPVLPHCQRAADVLVSGIECTCRAPQHEPYIDPYSGALLPATSSSAETFFRNVRQLHRWLMLGEPGDRDVGRQIVGASTLLFISMALTGLYLRWPRGPAARRLTTWFVPDFRLKGRAFLWNLHSAIGTWVLPAYLVIALTGLQWSYEWYRDGL